MGQRHQVFIRTINPLKVEGFSVANAEDREHFEKFEKEFGEGETTVLAFHHGWLFGLTAVGNALQVLDFNKKAEKLNNIFSKDYIERRACDKEGVSSFLNVVENIMSIQTNALSKKVGRFGFESFIYLNDGDSEIREDYTRGDNNDGCTIIDTITNKYCFIRHRYCSSTLDGLPIYTPVSAADYFKAYYPIEKEKLGYKGENKTEEQKNKLVAENLKLMGLVEKKFKSFKLLSLDEVRGFFPKTYENIEKGEEGY